MLIRRVVLTARRTALAAEPTPTSVLIAKVSVFWILVAGVVILGQQTDKAAYTRGMNDGYNSAATTIRSK